MTNKQLFQIIFIISLLGTLWSLYYGYFWDFFVNIASWDLRNRANAILPCDMCHYIRVAQYPLLFISWIALIYKQFHAHAKSILVMSILGLFFSTYKYLMEMWVVIVSDSGICNPNSPASCWSAVEVFWPYITLASLWIISFIVCIWCVFLILKDRKQ